VTLHGFRFTLCLFRPAIYGSILGNRGAIPAL
jgi:hypothetical protein